MADDKWVQLYVKAPAGNGYTTPQAMKRVDEHLTQDFPAAFVAPTGLPVQNEDGTFEVRVLVESFVPMVKNLLIKQYGLEIIKEIVN